MARTKYNLKLKLSQNKIARVKYSLKIKTVAK